MNSSPTKQPQRARRKYREEEKQHILANLDLEVADRTRKFEKFLADTLASFLMRHENEVTKVPRVIRTMTMEEFGGKYNGNIKACLQALAKDRLAQTVDVNMDASVRKRKWNPSQENDNQEEAPRAPKNARTTSPTKGNTRKPPTKTPKTPRNVRPVARVQPSPGPSKQPARTGSQSPGKPLSQIFPSSTHNRPPSSLHFNPLLPKTPAFPRRAKQNESLLSVNGSPVTNPFEFEYLSGALEPDSPDKSPPKNAAGGLLRRHNSIVLRRAPSISVIGSSQSSSGPSSSEPQVVASASMSRASALISVPTKDGQVLEIDPLLASPSALEDLDGITDSAKKQARNEMARLVHGALAKWTMT